MKKIIWILKRLVAKWHRFTQRSGNRLAMLTARFAPPVRAFISQPEPRSYGTAARGIQMSAGNFLVAGKILENHQGSLWDLSQRDAEFHTELHDFSWLDDLAAADTPMARTKAQTWLFEWIERYGSGKGQAWKADVTGRRVIRWINHALLVLNQQPPEKSKAYFKNLGVQAHFLAKRWKSVPGGLPRFEALTGLVYCGMALEGKDYLLQPALRALAVECQREIARDGSIPSRNPEALMEVFTLLSWVSQTASTEHLRMVPEILKAVERMAPSLRALRLGDGGLVRFHGGGTGQAGKLDQALADAGFRSPARMHGAMGYTRLISGATRLIMDTAKLPPVQAADNAHACTLAFELSSGQYPLLVNQGRSYGFSEEVRLATRSSAAHNTLTVGGAGSSEFMQTASGNKLLRSPTVVTVLTDQNRTGRAIRATHDGFETSHGLIHHRQISVINNGTRIAGIDEVKCESAADRSRFNRHIKRKKHKAIPFRLHFHIHPDVTAELDLNGTAISLHLPNQETWVFRKGAGRGEMKLVPSLYMDRNRLRPRATKQIVVTSRAIDYEGRVTWTLTRSV